MPIKPAYTFARYMYIFLKISKVVIESSFQCRLWQIILIYVVLCRQNMSHMTSEMAICGHEFDLKVVDRQNTTISKNHEDLIVFRIYGPMLK